MSIARKMLGSTHSLMGHSRIGLWAAEKIRNQAEAVIALAHGTTESALERNGEGDFLRSVAPSISYFIDVGANKGDWTAALLNYSPAAQGLLIDPSRSAMSKLRRSFAEINQLEILEAAVADKPGFLPFFEEADAGETSSLIGAVSSAANCRQVPITTIDREVSKRDWPRVDYLKIDAEGYDFLVLQGARELLSKGMIQVGQFEYGEGWRHAGSTLTYALKWLSEFGYECYLMTSKGVLAPNPERFREYFRYSNYIFIRSDLRETVMPQRDEAIFRRLY
ncbi:FkbM family methyltransferase [Acidobacterium sp. S8]|uniref:FkbM family methyltransferase n=1 Tax=Acidobacterium sp. S8 TaxID=1641854 RepID=UPI00131A7BB5|nr:FkbM family methyltransferase [Acidobacterium sp. S8]